MIERRLYMKATGVVRRIDDLGRIVIPKEIRRNFKINEGDSLEIFVDDGDIILKKYSLLDDMVEGAVVLVDSVSRIYDKNILITNKEKVIAAPKYFNRNFLGKELSNSIKEKIDSREESYSREGSFIIIDEATDFSFFLVPLLVNSDTLGSVILVDQNISEEDKNLARFISSILAG